MKDSNAATAVTSTPFHETNGQFSPDGHWLAYTSDESGRSEILVQSFPGGAPKWTVSSRGGDWVRWRRDGKELYYLAPDGNLMSAEVRAVRGELEFSTPVPRFEFPNHSLSAFAPSYTYDIAPDGRFLILMPVGSETPTLTVLTNWRGAQSPDQTH